MLEQKYNAQLGSRPLVADLEKTNQRLRGVNRQLRVDVGAAREALAAALGQAALFERMVDDLVAERLARGLEAGV